MCVVILNQSCKCCCYACLSMLHPEFTFPSSLLRLQVEQMTVDACAVIREREGQLLSLLDVFKGLSCKPLSTLVHTITLLHVSLPALILHRSKNNKLLENIALHKFYMRVQYFRLHCAQKAISTSLLFLVVL